MLIITLVGCLTILRACDALLLNHVAENCNCDYALTRKKVSTSNMGCLLKIALHYNVLDADLESFNVSCILRRSKEEPWTTYESQEDFKYHITPFNIVQDFLSIRKEIESILLNEKNVYKSDDTNGIDSKNDENNKEESTVLEIDSTENINNSTTDLSNSITPLDEYILEIDNNTSSHAIKDDLRDISLDFIIENKIMDLAQISFDRDDFATLEVLSDKGSEEYDSNDKESKLLQLLSGRNILNIVSNNENNKFSKLEGLTDDDNPRKLVKSGKPNEKAAMLQVLSDKRVMNRQSSNVQEVGEDNSTTQDDSDSDSDSKETSTRGRLQAEGNTTAVLAVNVTDTTSGKPNENAAMLQVLSDKRVMNRQSSNSSNVQEDDEDDSSSSSSSSSEEDDTTTVEATTQEDSDSDSDSEETSTRGRLQADGNTTIAVSADNVTNTTPVDSTTGTTISPTNTTENATLPACDQTCNPCDIIFTFPTEAPPKPPCLARRVWDFCASYVIPAVAVGISAVAVYSFFSARW